MAVASTETIESKEIPSEALNMGKIAYFFDATTKPTGHVKLHEPDERNAITEAL